MMHPLLRAVLGAVVAHLPLFLSAQVLTAPAARISDSAIHADYQTYEQVQARIRALNGPQRSLRDYHLAKAQCWLDVSFHEYTRNDRSPFPQRALEQSAQLVQGMESNATLPMDTPLVNEAERLRPDLWARVDALKAHGGLRCVANRVACAEVELVHAGNEWRQQGWRHANPYVQIAEDHLERAGEQAAACVAPPPPVVAVAPLPAPAPSLAPAPVSAPPTRAAQPVEFQANVLFNHDRHQRDQARALTLERLDVAIARALERGTSLQSVQLIGHADRTGRAAGNEKLAAARVQTVRDYLVAKGIPAVVIQGSARGDQQPVSACQGKFSSRVEELECLLPNRRVEVNFVGMRQP